MKASFYYRNYLKKILLFYTPKKQGLTDSEKLKIISDAFGIQWRGPLIILISSNSWNKFRKMILNENEKKHCSGYLSPQKENGYLQLLKKYGNKKKVGTVYLELIWREWKSSRKTSFNWTLSPLSESSKNSLTCNSLNSWRGRLQRLKIQITILTKILKLMEKHCSLKTEKLLPPGHRTYIERT